MAKEKTAKAAPKKATAKKTAEPKPEEKKKSPKIPVQGTSVNYTFTPEEMKQFNRGEGSETVIAKVVHTTGQEVVIKCEPQPGTPWQKGCFYGEKPGCWYPIEE